ncbi:MAG: hypothetical protein U9O94_00290 [Nanoarchaeota archaeon]|nr:hypothetical protein [Nanoarchaeota archaeon]
MKKLIVYLVLFCLALSSVFATTVTRDMPSSIGQGDILTVTFNAEDMEVGKSLTISDRLPSSFSIDDWSIEGANKEDITYEIKGNEYMWEIPAETENVVLTYNVNVPSSAYGNYEFDAVYFAPPAKMDNLRATLNVVGEAPAQSAPAKVPSQEDIREVWKTEPETNYATGVLIVIVVLLVLAIIIIWILRRK